MIYIKRTLWLLGYPIMWLLACTLFIVTTAFLGFECLCLYIKNGNIKDFFNCFEWVFYFIDWYHDVEPKED